MGPGQSEFASSHNEELRQTRHSHNITCLGSRHTMTFWSTFSEHFNCSIFERFRMRMAHLVCY